jgi:LacI family transcriptional regulator
VTLADLARLTGVSPATVSRALNRDPQISLRTQEHVRRAADALHYVPNNAARSLVIQATRTLGLLIPNTTDPLHGEVATAFEHEATLHGYNVMISSILTDPMHERGSLQIFVSHRADGVAIMGSLEEPQDVIDVLRPSPVVLIAAENPRLTRRTGSLVGTISADDRSGVTALVAHLVDQGCRRLAYVAGPHVASNVIRRDAAQRAVSQRGVQRRLTVLPAGADAWRQPEDVAARVAAERPDAVICYDDKLALALMDALREHRIRVPEDIAVTGFDDIPFAARSRPRLTTVAQPAEEMGRHAARMLLAAVRDREMSSSENLPVELVVRESSLWRRSPD